jgi:heme-degrading monooxygenase HmoA
MAVYILDKWTARPGHEQACLTSCAKLMAWTIRAVSNVAQSQFRLMRDLEQPGHIVCPVAWESAEAIDAWRALPEYRERPAALRSLLERDVERTLEFAVKRDAQTSSGPRAIYTVDAWTVKPEREEAFLTDWQAFMEWMLTTAPGISRSQFRLFRDIRRRNQFFCPIGWESADAVAAWQSRPEYRGRLAASERADTLGQRNTNDDDQTNHTLLP